MDSFRTHTGVAMPLRLSNVDTDQIIPAGYLKRVSRTGFSDGLFRSWRDNDPTFPLNDTRYATASILVAGAEFGVGSSREHAVWALRDWGFRAVLAPSFGDIFRGNALGEGLLPVELDRAVIETLWTLLDVDPAATITVDVANRQVTAGDRSWAFRLDDFSRWRLLEGLNDIDLTLRGQPEIAAYERSRAGFLPTVQ